MAARMPKTTKAGDPLSPVQARAYRAMWNYVREHGYPPAMREVTQLIGLRPHTNMATEIYAALEAKGYIARGPRFKSRAVKLLVDPDANPRPQHALAEPRTCPRCKSPMRMQVQATVSAPAKFERNLAKANLRRGDVYLLGVNWETADFICERPTCGHVTPGYGNYVTRMEREVAELQAQLAALTGNDPPKPRRPRK